METCRLEFPDLPVFRIEQIVSVPPAFREPAEPGAPPAIPSAARPLRASHVAVVVEPPKAGGHLWVSCLEITPANDTALDFGQIVSSRGNIFGKTCPPVAIGRKAPRIVKLYNFRIDCGRCHEFLLENLHPCGPADFWLELEGQVVCP